jgi:hypothetical protein
MSENLAQTLGDDRMAQDLVQQAVEALSNLWKSLRAVELHAQQITGVDLELEAADLEDYVLSGGISRAEARMLLINLVEAYSVEG